MVVIRYGSRLLLTRVQKCASSGSSSFLHQTRPASAILLEKHEQRRPTLHLGRNGRSYSLSSKKVLDRTGLPAAPSPRTAPLESRVTPVHDADSTDDITEEDLADWKEQTKRLLESSPDDPWSDGDWNQAHRALQFWTDRRPISAETLGNAFQLWKAMVHRDPAKTTTQQLNAMLDVWRLAKLQRGVRFSGTVAPVHPIKMFHLVVELLPPSIPDVETYTLIIVTMTHDKGSRPKQANAVVKHMREERIDFRCMDVNKFRCLIALWMKKKTAKTARRAQIILDAVRGLDVKVPG